MGYQWPNLYYQIEEDLVVCTLSRSSSVTGENTSGTTTLVDPPSEEEELLHEIPLPPDPLPEIPGLPSISEINCRTVELHQRIEAHNRSLREKPQTPAQRLAAILTRIRSGINLDKLAFPGENVTYCHVKTKSTMSKFRGEGYNDMPEYIKVEMRLSLCVDQILTQVLCV